MGEIKKQSLFKIKKYIKYKNVLINLRKKERKKKEST